MMFRNAVVVAVVACGLHYLLDVPIWQAVVLGILFLIVLMLNDIKDHQ